MSNKRDHSIYTLAAINDYLQGRLSPAEMHAMEKAALQDPFLADALEGLHDADVSTAQTDLAAIQSQLSAVKNPPAKLVRTASQNNWLKIAASIILIAAIGLFGWYFFRQDTHRTELARQTTPVLVLPPAAKLKEPPKVSTGKTDAFRPPVSNDKTTPAITPDGSHDAKVAESIFALPAPDSQALTVLADQARVADAYARRDSRSVSKTVVTGTAMTIGAGNKRLQDTGTNFGIGLNDSLRQAGTTAFAAKPNVTYSQRSKETAPASEQAGKILMDTARGALDEVIITGAGNRKTAQSRFGGHPRDSSIRPANGWAAFYAHLDSSIQRRSYAVSNKQQIPRVTRVITIALLLDKFGKPIGVTILSSNDSSANDIVVKEIKNGPAWINTDGSFATGSRKAVLNF